MDTPYILDVSNVVALESAIAESGTPLATLMERAGHAIVREVVELLDTPDGGTDAIVVLAGSGNNGGDGWVAAGALAERGYTVTLVTPKSADALRAEPARQWAQRVTEAAAPTLTLRVDPDDEVLAALLAKASLVIDALLGTGFAGTELRDPFGRWITLLRAEQTRRTAAEMPLTVVAADVPSGVSAQSGAAARPSVQADLTVTMIVGKPGLYQDAARSLVGRIVVDDLDVAVADYLPPVFFRHAIPDDLDALVELYTLMIEVTTGTDNDPMWLAGYHPSREGLASSIADGALIVGESRDVRTLVAAAVLDQDWNAGYDQGAWTIPAEPSEVWTLHLVAVHPAWQHQGLGQGLMEYAAQCARSLGGTVFRIDVLASNEKSLAFYERRGFHRVGPVTLHYDDPRVTEFVLFEKSL